MDTSLKTDIKKLHLEETIAFAISHIPDVDRPTLEKLLALVYADGAHGAISAAQLNRKMRQLLKYVPTACPRSLIILADLLELPTPASTIRATRTTEAENPQISQIFSFLSAKSV